MTSKEVDVIKSIYPYIKSRKAALLDTSIRGLTDLPQYILSYRGRFVWLWVKDDDTELNGLEELTISQLHDSDAIGGIVYTPADAICIFDEADRIIERERHALMTVGY